MAAAGALFLDFLDDLHMSLPNHVAVIMDGNGRWAKARFMPRVEGHRRGISALRSLVEASLKAGIKHLTVFAFSSENWKRPADEVGTLMRFFVSGLKKEALPLRDAGVRLNIIGDRSAFSRELIQAIEEAENTTALAKTMSLNICINYGGRWDIVQAAKQLVANDEEITEQSLGSYLSLPWAGEVDLLIRTGGEQRVSNFLLWQSAYAEMWFDDVLWPDFSAKDLQRALDWYASRERRFGRTGDQVKSQL